MYDSTTDQTHQHGRNNLSVGVIGLGRMGLGAALRLKRAGWLVSGYDVSPDSRCKALEQGLDVAGDLAQLCRSLPAPRLIWLMVPAGEPVDMVLFGDPSTKGAAPGLADHLKPGDIIIEAGNSFYRDSQRRAAALEPLGLAFLDCGTSGGVEGAEKGFCLMVGGPPEIFEAARPLFASLAGPDGYTHVGPTGAGHFVKMVHNAIEYGMLEAIGEGFELLAAGPYPGLDFQKISHLWNNGSVIRGWLMELAERAFARDPRFEAIQGVIGGGSTGSWAIEEAWKAGVPFPAIAMAYAMRQRSRQEDSFAAKVVAGLRYEFGRHETVPAKETGTTTKK